MSEAKNRTPVISRERALRVLVEDIVSAMKDPVINGSAVTDAALKVIAGICRDHTRLEVEKIAREVLHDLYRQSQSSRYRYVDD